MNNKSIKIWANYLLGGCVSALLLWFIYKQTRAQFSELDLYAWQQHWNTALAVLAVLLMLANLFLESLKWHRLLLSTGKQTYGQSVASYLAGIAFSIITPNRIGEYPGRILYLSGRHTAAYISISVSGILSQLAGLYFWGLVGLVFYNVLFPSVVAQVALAACIIINIFINLLYWRVNEWLAKAAKIKYLRRFSVYARMAARMPTRQRIEILAIALVRVAVFAAQYLILLRLMHVAVPIVPGFCLAALSFWVMAVVPSLALTELGVRGATSIYLFSHYSDNTVGMVAASILIWLLNLIVPSIAGSLLIMKMKWIK